MKLLQLVGSGDLDGVVEFINGGGDVHIANEHGLNAVFVCALAEQSENTVSILGELVKAGISVNTGVQFGTNPDLPKALLGDEEAYHQTHLHR